MRAALCLALAGLAALAPLGEASAQSLEVGLDLDVGLDVEPGSCVDAAALTSALEAIGAHVAASKEISIRVAETDGEVSLEIREAGVVLGGRTIAKQGLPCHEVVDAVALAVAVTTDALSNAPGRPAAEHHAPEHRAAELLLRSHPSDSPEPAPDGPADRGSRHLATSLELGWTLGMLPKTSAALAAMVDISGGPPPVRGVEPELSARAGFFAALPSGTGDTGPGGGEIVTSVYAGRLDLCGGVGSSLVRLRGCASAVGGGLVTVGGEDEGRLVAGGRLDVRWRATDRLGFQAGADMLANVGPVSVTSRDGDGLIDHRKLGSFALVLGGGPVVEFF